MCHVQATYWGMTPKKKYKDEVSVLIAMPKTREYTPKEPFQVHSDVDYEGL